MKWSGTRFGTIVSRFKSTDLGSNLGFVICNSVTSSKPLKSSNMLGRCVGSRPRWYGFEFWLLYLTAMWPWSTPLTLDPVSRSVKWG